jgi:hypothetical protein
MKDIKNLNSDNEKKRVYIEAYDLEGDIRKKTANQWADYQARQGNPKGNSKSVIAKRYANKAINGLSNQQIVDYSLIPKKVGVRGKAKPKPRTVDCNSMLSRFNRTRLAG